MPPQKIFDYLVLKWRILVHICRYSGVLDVALRVSSSSYFAVRNRVILALAVLPQYT